MISLPWKYAPLKLLSFILLNLNTNVQIALRGRKKIDLKIGHLVHVHVIVHVSHVHVSHVHVIIHVVHVHVIIHVVHVHL